ncbi:MAG: beta strand repeat-containing protein, partial [Candidatus Paceibacteria bacterium]
MYGSTVASGNGIDGISIAPDGTSLYAADASSNVVWQYSRPAAGTAGTFTSGVINTNSGASYTTLSYVDTLNGQTLTIDARAGNSATPDGTWTAWQTNIASGGSISGLSGNQYIQYRANFSTTVSGTTPTLNSVTINYVPFSVSGTLISSVYDTGAATNAIGRISWVETATTSVDTVKFQVRSSPDGATWSAWCGYADCSGTSYFTDASSNGIDLVSTHPLRSGGDDRYFQYKVYLNSDNLSTPTLTSVSVKYVVNIAPDFNPSYGTAGVSVSQDATATDSAWGKVQIGYSVRDADTTLGSVTPGFITPSFEYSTNNGSTWTPIPSGDLQAADITNKAVTQTIYNTYTATWTASSTLPTAYNTTMKVRVTANDNEGANNTTQVVSPAFTLDSTVPVVSATALTGTTTPATIKFTGTDNSQLQYRLCNDSGFPSTDAQGNSCAWSTLAASPISPTVNWTFTNSSNDAPVYLQVQDAYGNAATQQTLTMPMAPANFNFVDVSNIGNGYYAEFLNWSAFLAGGHPAYTFASYKVYKSTDGVNYTLLTTITDPTLNYYLDVMGATTARQYYKVVLTTTGGYTSPYSAIMSDVPDGYGGQAVPPESAPTISIPDTGTATSTVSSSSELITFTTNKIATSTVMYGTAQLADCSYSSATAPTTSYATNQSITLTGLTASQKYYFCVKATSTGNNSVTASTTNAGVPLSFTTGPANAISGVTASSINNSAFTVSWTTASSSDSYVTYAPATGLSNGVLANATTTGSAPLVSAHQVTIAGLTSGTQYAFSVKSTDSLGNAVTNNNSGAFYFATTTIDVAPIVSNIATSTVLANSAIVTFNTDKLATSTVLYGSGGTCGSYTGGGSQSTTAFATAQSLTLTGLNSSTAYSFCVKAQDVAGTMSTATSTTSTGMALGFTTLSGPIITNVHAGSMDATTYNVLWDTATSSDAYVYYSTSSSLTNLLSAGNASSTQNGSVFNHQVTLTGLTTGIPYYFYVKSTDSNGNFSTNTNSPTGYYTIPAKRDVTPPVISNITTSVPPSADQAAIVWKTDKLANSQVYYGTSSGTYPNFTGVNSALSIYHVITLASTTPNGAGGTTALSPRGLYHFIVISTDASGNTATSTDQVLDTSNVDNTLPVISAISATPKSTSAVVTFTTSKVATSTAEYSTDGGTTWTPVSDTVFGVSHSLTFSGLTPNTTYLYQVRASDAIGNTSAWTSGGSTTFTTTGGPIISSVSVPGITLGSTAVTITWNTSTSSDSHVYYSQDSSLATPLTVSVAALTTAHSVKISGLSATTKYYFYVTSADSIGELTTDNNNSTYYNFTTTADLAAPVISAISVPVTSPGSAVITWQTDKLATSQVEYGMVASTTDGTYPTVTDINSTPTIFHIVTLSPLVGGDIVAGNNTYYYRVKSVDTTPAANVAVSAEQTFTTVPQGQTKIVTVTQFISQSSGTGTNPVTTPPQITSVTSGTIDAFDAQINVVTDKDTTTFLSYGTTTAYGSTEGDKNLASSKSITLSRLQEGTTYHYQVRVTDQYGNVATGNDQTFTTQFASEALSNLTSLQQATDLQGKIEQLIQSSLPSLAPPFITQPTVSSTTEDTATITWTTNIKSIGSLKYATDADYAAKNEYSTEVSEGQTSNTSHSVTLTGLTPNTLYHVQARSYVFPQVVGKSPDLTFSTKASPITVNVVSVKNSGFTVAWQTNDPTSSIVEYRNTKTGESNLVTDDMQKTYHDVQIQNLPAGTTYLVSVAGVNANGNRIDSGSPITITTSVDVTPPVISNFKVDNALVPGRVGFIQTVVSWQTDKPSNSAVYYQEGASPATGGAELANKVESLDTYTTSHIMIVANLKAGTVYSI